MNTENPHENRAAHAPRRRHPYLLPLALGAGALILLAAGIVPKLTAASALAAQTAAQSTITVSVIAPRPAPNDQELLLPGAAQPYADAAIFARTGGYIERWQVDIGAAVRKGQLLAQILTPELDAQLRQAEADMGTAQANYALAKSTSDRWQAMLKTQSVSAQDAEMRLGDMQARRAMVASAAANVQRLRELVSYEALRAPFDGIVTARNVDVGTLVSAAGSAGQGAGGELFHIQQVDTLRVFANIPQNDSNFVNDATAVSLTTAQFAGRQFPGKVVRNAGAIDPSSRTLRVEVDFDNRQHVLMPGAYVQAHFALHSARPALDLPVSAILFRPDGLNVAVVDAQNRTLLKKITIGRDFGTHMEVTSNLAAGDRVIDNPGDSITTGQPVQIAPAAAAAAGKTAASATSAS